MIRSSSSSKTRQIEKSHEGVNHSQLDTSRCSSFGIQPWNSITTRVQYLGLGVDLYPTCGGDQGLCFLQVVSTYRMRFVSAVLQVGMLPYPKCQLASMPIPSYSNTGLSFLFLFVKCRIGNIDLQKLPRQEVFPQEEVIRITSLEMKK